MNTVFFIASKLIWAIIRPETWLVLGLAWGCFLLARNNVNGGVKVGQWGGAKVGQFGVRALGRVALN